MNYIKWIFLRKCLTFERYEAFPKKAPSQMFEKVLITPLRHFCIFKIEVPGVNNSKKNWVAIYIMSLLNFEKRVIHLWHPQKMTNFVIPTHPHHLRKWTIDVWSQTSCPCQNSLNYLLGAYSGYGIIIMKKARMKLLEISSCSGLRTQSITYCIYYSFHTFRENNLIQSSHTPKEPIG